MNFFRFSSFLLTDIWKKKDILFSNQITASSWPKNIHHLLFSYSALLFNIFPVTLHRSFEFVSYKNLNASFDKRLFLCCNCIVIPIVVFLRATFQTFFTNKETLNVFVNLKLLNMNQMKTSQIHCQWQLLFNFQSNLKEYGWYFAFHYSTILKITFRLENFGLSKCLQNKFEC